MALRSSRAARTARCHVGSHFDFRPATLTFGTAAAEIMECVGGACEYKLDGSNEWKRASVGDSFHIPANSKFDIRVTEAYHYICHYA